MVKTVVIAGLDKLEVNKDKTLARFYYMLKNLPKAVEEQAKEIDGANFEPSCFGFMYEFNIKNKTYYIKKNKQKQVYYIDEDGNRHWMDCVLPISLLQVATRRSNKKLKELHLR